MSERTEAEQREHERREQERRERERRAAIYRQIGEKQNQITSLNSSLSALSIHNANLTNSVNKWTNAKQGFFQEEITRTVTVKNVFEGTAAESVKKQNEQEINKMDGKIKQTNDVQSGIRRQIGKVNTKIGTLNSEITSLRNQL